MIQVCYGSGDYQLDRFMYESIAARMPSDTIVIVPDQFTLQAEEDALRYMRADVLMNLEVMSPAGFARRVLDNTGSPRGIPVNRYGRYMLLVSILRKMETDDAGVFSDLLRTGRTGRSTLAHMLNQGIAELKQFGIGPEELVQIANRSGEGLLNDKLIQAANLYRAYQEKIGDRFHDHDDLQAEVAARVGFYPRASSAGFWIYGFDYLSPDMMDLICAVSRSARSVHIVMNGERTGEEEYDLFLRMTALLRSKCAEHGDSYSEIHVPEQYLEKREPAVRVVKAGGFFEEAETVASEIMELVREKGLRFREIAVICNDLQTRGTIISRVFEQYGIPLFVDRKRAILQEPSVEFICALIDCVSGNLQFDDVFRMLKTGFSPLTDEECGRLEMYCLRYHIKSGRWKKEFRYGREEEGEDGLAEINQMRSAVYQFIRQFREQFRGKKTVREKTAVLYEFLTETVHMPERIGQYVSEMEERQLYEAAASTSQIWKIIVEIMDQMVEVTGEEEMTAEEYSEILREGFREVEIGIIPSTADQVLLGNMHRTRTGSLKALFVSGANDGVLPEDPVDEGLFSDLEKEEMARIYQRPVGRTGMIRSMEQDLAISRNLSKAEQQLMITYSAQDMNGAELRPSILVRRYLQRYGKEIEEKSAAESGDGLRLIQTRQGVIPHLAEVFRSAADNGTDPGDDWKAAALIMGGSPSFLSMKRGLSFSRRTERLDREKVRKLYGKGKGQELTLSPSRMESFVRCPFSFYVQYGLKPVENRSFDVDSRSVGDIFHYCMKRTASALTLDGLPVNDPSSPWMTVTEEELREMTLAFATDFADRYREGVFGYSARERYIRERIEEVIFLNVAVMVMQVRKGKIRSIYFEKEFRRGGRSAFPPVRLELQEGGVVYLEGIIDRIDEFQGKEDDSSGYLRIIDYKTGETRFKRQDVTEGIRLQLVIYLQGAMGGIPGARPAGVFYFPAGEKSQDISGRVAEKVDVYTTGSRLDGVMIRNDGMIEGMDATIGMNEESDVIPVRRSGKGYVNLRGSERVMDSEAFEEMMKKAGDVLQEAAEQLAGGSAEVRPKRSGSYNACSFCGLDSICHRKVIEKRME